jgi:hypothetical protein
MQCEKTLGKYFLVVQGDFAIDGWYWYEVISGVVSYGL